MSEALRRAIDRAKHGLSWDYPCLIWVADYLADATGRDPAAPWRAITWTEQAALAALVRAGRAGQGETAVERALDATGMREGWVRADGPQQGAIMIGCYTADDGRTGIPAIFDGQDRWILSHDGAGIRTERTAPHAIWEIT